MSLLKSIRRHWFAAVLYVLFCVFFVVASVISASTYVSVIDAQERIGLSNISYDASLLPNGTLLISFSADVVNPSRYDIAFSTVNWEVTVVNGTSGPGWLIPVTGEYWSASTSPILPAREEITLVYESFVADPATLSRLRGYVNYSNSQGGSMTLESIPYRHWFTANGWLGDFGHDYLREFYLNDLVKVALEHDSGWGP